ncbi:putative toxin-antitoxin system toxin component, PIN family [Nitrospira sp. M1]
MPHNAIVDASVLVSAFLFAESVPRQVIRLARQGLYALHFSPILIEEVSRSLKNPRLKKPYSYTDDDVRIWRAELNEIGLLWTKPLPKVGKVCRDPDDDHVIAVAVAVKAKWIVTGDLDLLDLGEYKGIRIVKARTFVDEILAG